MELFILICGFVGGWLLVAGPIYQAALELRNEELDRDGFGSTLSTVPEPPKVSSWWWLIPPVAYLKQRRRNGARRDAMMAALKPHQREQLVNFMNKATGWMIVGVGAFFIAIKETWELIEHLHWHPALFWILIVVMPLLAFGNVAVQSSRTRGVLAEEPRQGRPRAGH